MTFYAILTIAYVVAGQPADQPAKQYTILIGRLYRDYTTKERQDDQDPY